MISLQASKDAENIEELRKNLEELVAVLQRDNTMVEYLKEKYERSEKEKQLLMIGMEKMKKKLDNARRRIKDEDKRFDDLERSVERKNSTIASLMMRHEQTKGEINELRKQLNISEKEKYDVMLNIEKFILEIELKEESKGCDEINLETPLCQLSYHDREMIRCGKLIHYAKNMLSLKGKLDHYANELQRQRFENKRSKEELTKYRMNYWDRTMFYNLVMQDLYKLENLLPSKLLGCRRNKAQRDVVRRIKDLLAESMTSYV